MPASIYLRNYEFAIVAKIRAGAKRTSENNDFCLFRRKTVFDLLLRIFLKIFLRKTKKSYVSRLLSSLALMKLKFEG